MPIVVRICGWAGLTLSLMSLTIFAISLFTEPTGGLEKPHVEIDRVVLPSGILLSVLGIAVGVGLLTARRWAYWVAMWGLTAIAIPMSLLLVWGLPWSWGMASAAVLSALAVLLRASLNRDRVHFFFGLPGKRRRGPMAVPGSLHLAVGLLGFILSFWPLPTPMFGIWLESWQTIAINLVFASGSLALGFGMLRPRPWAFQMAIALAAATMLYTAGLAWNPNPHPALNNDFALSYDFVVKCTILLVLGYSWTLWRIHLFGAARTADGPDG